MPKLSDVHYATKPLKKFYNYQKPPYKHKHLLPPILKDQMNETTIRSKGAVCLQQLTNLLDCWNKKDFDESKCKTQLLAYNECIAAEKWNVDHIKAEMLMLYQRALARPVFALGHLQKAFDEVTEAIREGKTAKVKGRYPGSLVNKMFRRYPLPKTGIKIEKW